MTGFITALTGTGGITAATFWDSITPMAPLVIILIGVAFGYRILRKSINGASKAKAKI